MQPEVMHTSESAEYGTPPEPCDAARRVMGYIDIDPASSALFNQVVQADSYYTKEDNGFLKDWHGNAFVNPPGGYCDMLGQPVIKARKASGKKPARDKCSVTGDCGLPPGHTHDGCHSAAKMWWFKLAREKELGHVESALFVAFNADLLQTTQVDTPSGLSIPLDHRVCYPRNRVSFLYESAGKLFRSDSPPHVTVYVFIAANTKIGRKFHDEFSVFGRCKL